MNQISVDAVESTKMAVLDVDSVRVELEKLLTRRNVLNDSSVSTMLRIDWSIPVASLLQHPSISALKLSAELVLAAAAASSILRADFSAGTVYPELRAKRTTLIIRNLPEDASEEEVGGLIKCYPGESAASTCPEQENQTAAHKNGKSVDVVEEAKILEMHRDLCQSWFVTFVDEEITQKLAIWLRTQRFREGDYLRVALKASRDLKNVMNHCYFPGYPSGNRSSPHQNHHHHFHNNPNRGNHFTRGSNFFTSDMINYHNTFCVVPNSTIAPPTTTPVADGSDSYPVELKDGGHNSTTNNNSQPDIAHGATATQTKNSIEGSASTAHDTTGTSTNDTADANSSAEDVESKTANSGRGEYSGEVELEKNRVPQSDGSWSTDKGCAICASGYSSYFTGRAYFYRQGVGFQRGRGGARFRYGNEPQNNRPNWSSDRKASAPRVRSGRGGNGGNFFQSSRGGGRIMGSSRDGPNSLNWRRPSRSPSNPPTTETPKQNADSNSGRNSTAKGRLEDMSNKAGFLNNVADGRSGMRQGSRSRRVGIGNRQGVKHSPKSSEESKSIRTATQQEAYTGSADNVVEFPPLSEAITKSSVMKGNMRNNIDGPNNNYGAAGRGKGGRHGFTLGDHWPRQGVVACPPGESDE